MDELSPQEQDHGSTKYEKTVNECKRSLLQPGGSKAPVVDAYQKRKRNGRQSI